MKLVLRFPFEKLEKFSFQNIIPDILTEISVFFCQESDDRNRASVSVTQKERK